VYETAPQNAFSWSWFHGKTPFQIYEFLGLGKSRGVKIALSFAIIGKLSPLRRPLHRPCFGLGSTKRVTTKRAYKRSELLLSGCPKEHRESLGLGCLRKRSSESTE